MPRAPARKTRPKREERFNFHLPAAERERWRRVAAAHGRISIAALIRLAVEEYIRTHKLSE